MTFSLLLLLCASFCAAQNPVVLAPVPQFQQFTQSGLPLSFGCVFTYQSQSTNPLSTYTDFSGQYANQNPVPLSAGGSANIWIKAGQAYTFTVKSSGGTNCALGTTLYTVDGIGGGTSQLTTVVTPSGGSATFTDQAENQLFTLTLTGNVVGQPITAVGIIPPGFITFQITQDGVGSRTFSWPANAIAPATICPTANCVTTQTFLWNGTNATAIGPASYSIGPAQAVPNLFDYGLTPSSTVCVNSAFELVSGASCSGINTITFNGQTVVLGGSGNVNAGAGSHSIALNEGAGAAIAGLTLGADQIAVGAAGADPTAKSLPNCTDTSGQHLNYATGGSVTCGTSASGAGVVKAKVNVTSCTLAANGGEWNCAGTITWGVTLSTTTYYAECAMSIPPGGYAIPAGYQAKFFWNTKTTTTMTYAIDDDHSGSLGATYSLSCIAIE